MIAVRLLGPMDVRDADGQEIHTLLRQPKRVALLSYLAAATPRGFHRRDTLLGLFWPESTQAQARHTLSQGMRLSTTMPPSRRCGRKRSRICSRWWNTPESGWQHARGEKPEIEG